MIKSKYPSYTIDTSAKCDWLDVVKQFNSIKEFPCTILTNNRVTQIADKSELWAFQTGFEIGVNMILDRWEAKEPRPEPRPEPIKEKREDINNEGVPAKNTVSALIYSGWRNPEKQLTLEEMLHIEDLVAQLSEVTQIQEPGNASGGFSAYLQDRNGKLLALRAYPIGSVFIWYNEKQAWIPFADTSGICAYLMLIMGPTLQQFNKEITAAVG